MRGGMGERRARVQDRWRWGGGWGGRVVVDEEGMREGVGWMKRSVKLVQVGVRM